MVKEIDKEKAGMAGYEARMAGKSDLQNPYYPCPQWHESIALGVAWHEGWMVADKQKREEEQTAL